MEIKPDLRQGQHYPGPLEKTSGGQQPLVGALLHQGNRSLEGISVEVGPRSL